MERTLADLCNLLHGELIGDGSIVIQGVGTLGTVRQGELAFADNPKRVGEALAGQAAAVVVSREVKDLQGRSGIRVTNPKLAFAILLGLFYPEAAASGTVHPTAVLGRNVQLGEGATLLPYAVLGDDVSLGRGTRIGAGAYVGAGVTLGEQCLVDANVVIYDQTKIGDRVLIHGGAVIGGDGFGYVFHDGAYVKVPQVGNVVIENDVEIGCNVCIDRATIGSTVIRQGTKIDNLVQIAHNNHIGKHVVMAGQVGLAGSVRVGDYTVMGGKVGVADHVTIGDQVRIGGSSLVLRSVPSGQTIWGYPARPIREAKRQVAMSARLPALVDALAGLLVRVKQLETQIARLAGPRAARTAAHPVKRRRVS